MKDYSISDLPGLTASQLCECAGVKPQWSRPSQSVLCKDCICQATHGMNCLNKMGNIP